MKRMLLLISIVLIFAAALLIWDAILLRDAAQTVHDSQNGTQEDTTPGNTVGIIPDGTSKIDQNELQVSQEASDTQTILKSEPVPVEENTSEYEMKLTLCQGDDLKTFLRLEYFQDGIGAVKELDERQLPEISAAPESTSSQHNVLNVEIFKQVLLNPVYGQLYLLINSEQADEFTQTTFYRIDLADMAVHKLFSYPARYGDIVFNRDFSMLAYSFDDPPHMSVYQEDRVLEVYDCKTGKFAVRGNRDGDRQLIGINHSKGYLYDYEFVEWESLDIVRLKQSIRKMTDLDVEPVAAVVLYDIRKNLLMSSVGGEWKIPQDMPGEASGESNPKDSGSTDSSDSNKQGESTEGTAKGEDTANDPDADNTADSEPTANDANADNPANVVKAFYTYLQSEEDYDKAMRLLDDKFKLRMAMLRQFGVEEISKSDIDAEYDQNSVSLYSDLLKAAKLDTISNETIMKDNTVIITYYQNLGLSADSNVRQLMSATLVKVNKEYKIVLIEDGIQ